MKQISAGVLIVNSGRILLGHSTHNTHWDIFKGKIDPGETAIEAALRELKEESGISLKANDIKDLGQFSYTKKKNLHLFLYEDAVGIDAQSCHCESKVDDRFPEMDDFKWVDYSEVGNFCTKPMTKVLKQILG